MGNTHKSDKDQPQDETSPVEKKTSADKPEAQISDSDKNLDGKESAQAEAKKIVSEPKREPKNVTITDIELEKLKGEVAEFKDKYLRVLAESENARKRLQ